MDPEFKFSHNMSMSWTYPLEGSSVLQWGMIAACACLTITNLFAISILIWFGSMACSPSSSKNHKHKSRLCCWGGKPKHKRHGKVPSVDQGKIKPLIPTSSHVIGYGMVEEEDEMNRLDLGLEAYEKPHLENIQKADPNLKYNDMSKELNDAIVKVTPQLQPLSVMSDDLELLEQIGVGSSGCVFRAKFMGVTVAVKQCLICDLLEDPLKEYMKETQIMSSIRHPNVVQFIGATIKPPFFYIVVEYCPRGSVDKIIRTSYSEVQKEPPKSSLAIRKERKISLMSNNLRLSIDNDSSIARFSYFKSGLSLQRKCDLLLDAAHGLQYLKSKNIIHRDVKVS